MSSSFALEFLSNFILIKANSSNHNCSRKSALSYELTKTRTSPYYPQSDGLIECFNRTLLSMLSTSVDEDPFHFQDHLQKVCMAYNTSIQSSTIFTPFFLMFGREARLPIDMQFDLPQSSSSVTNYAASLSISLMSQPDLKLVLCNRNRQRIIIREFTDDHLDLMTWYGYITPVCPKEVIGS